MEDDSCVFTRLQTLSEGRISEFRCLFQLTYCFLCGVYRIAYCYLDNDFAGKQAQDTLDLLMPGRIFGMSSKFTPYNDLNDYLMQQPP